MVNKFINIPTPGSPRFEQDVAAALAAIRAAITEGLSSDSVLQADSVTANTITASGTVTADTVTTDTVTADTASVGTVVASAGYQFGFVSGLTADIAVAKTGGGTRTLHFAAGLFTGYTDS
jgi:hypothetical protein